MKNAKSLKLIELLKSNPSNMLSRDGYEYFGLNDLEKLQSIVKIKDIFGMTSFIAYVFCLSDVGIMEAYWDTLSIQLMENPKDNLDNFILKDTTKSSIDEVDPVVANRYRNTYFEIKSGDIEGFKKAITTYVEFMQKEEMDIIEEVKSMHPESKISGVFYEIA